MHRFIKKSSNKVGMAPGSVVHVGERKAEKVRVVRTTYDLENVFESEHDPARPLDFPAEAGRVTWLTVRGLHDTEFLKRVGEYYGISDLTLEDVVHTGHRPKIEEGDGYVSILFKRLYLDEERTHVMSEHIAVILKDDLVLTFEETEVDSFLPVRERLRKGRGRLRSLKAAYLAYALMDTVVDGYFSVLEAMEERMEALEDRVLEDPDPERVEDIHELRKEMVFFKKQVWPLRDVVASMVKEEIEAFDEPMLPFLRDLYDHILQIMESVDSFRDVLANLIDLYLSLSGSRMNEVMKVLTVIATLFIPLTFIAGIYGMNFKVMPELEWRYGYFAVMSVMGVLALAMLYWFRKKDWL